MKVYTPQTAAETIVRIEASKGDPWIAYRDFLEDWHYNSSDRTTLIATPPVAHTERGRRWLNLLGAAVEVLCRQAGMDAPAWAKDTSAAPKKPWCTYGKVSEQMTAWAQSVTPPEFLRHNILASPSVVERV